MRMKINEIIFIRNSYVSIIRNSVTGPLSRSHQNRLAECLGYVFWTLILDISLKK